MYKIKNKQVFLAIVLLSAVVQAPMGPRKSKETLLAALIVAARQQKSANPLKQELRQTHGYNVKVK